MLEKTCLAAGVSWGCFGSKAVWIFAPFYGSELRRCCIRGNSAEPQSVLLNKEVLFSRREFAFCERGWLPIPETKSDAYLRRTCEGAEWGCARTLDLERPAEAGALGMWDHPASQYPGQHRQMGVNRTQILKYALTGVSCSLRSGIANIHINMYGSKSQSIWPCTDLPLLPIPEVTHSPTMHPDPRIWPKFGVKLP